MASIDKRHTVVDFMVQSLLCVVEKLYHGVVARTKETNRFAKSERLIDENRAMSQHKFYDVALIGDGSAEWKRPHRI